MILREPGSTQPGSYLAFLVRIQTVDPSAFEMPVAPGKRSRGFFIFEGELQGCPLLGVKRTSEGAVGEQARISSESGPAERERSRFGLQCGLGRPPMY
ncbi:MAG: hypothetical protein WAN68_13380, partial [Pseudolabrys sp.]